MAGMVKEKSSKAFRSISEASDILAVPQHVLRFWESKFGKLRPMKRAGGRRYYRPEDIELLQTIKELLYEQKYTIKGAQKLLSAKGAQIAAFKELVGTGKDVVGKDAEVTATVPHTPLSVVVSGQFTNGQAPLGQAVSQSHDSTETQAALASLLRSAVSELKAMKEAL